MRLPRTLLIGGKGGVGKTTCAAGLATHFANAGERVLVVTTDPARNAGGRHRADGSTAWQPPRRLPLPRTSTAGSSTRPPFGTPFSIGGARRSPRSSIAARTSTGPTSTGSSTRRCRAPRRSSRCSRSATLIADTSAQGYERIVVDTAPTGHTLRLLDLPTTFRALVDLLETMQDKHRFMVRALTHRYRRDASDELIGQLRGKLGDLTNDLTDPTHVAAILVSRPEPVVVAESSRYVLALEGASTAVHSIVMNSWTGTARERRCRHIAFARRRRPSSGSRFQLWTRRRTPSRTLAS